MTAPFPPGCPPSDAHPVHGAFYRLAERRLALGDSTTPASWLRPYETRSGRYWRQVDVPEAHGLSIYADLEDLKAARDISPYMGRKPIAQVMITESDGWVKSTPVEGGQSHHDWWTDPYDLIPAGVVVEEGREE